MAGSGRIEPVPLDSDEYEENEPLRYDFFDSYWDWRKMRPEPGWRLDDLDDQPGKKKDEGTDERIMDPAKRKALQAAGWKFGDAADFLGMDEEDRQLLDARVELALAVRRQRESRHLSQKELGAKLKTSQPRVAKIERAATDVSLDQLVRAFAAAGGKIEVKVVAEGSKRGKVAGKKARSTLILEAVTSE